MGWLLADIGTTVVVALAYWTVAVLRDAARSLALAGRRARTRGATRLRAVRHAPGAAVVRALVAEDFVAAEPHCARPQAPRS
jgi:hypothetical protein